MKNLCFALCFGLGVALSGCASVSKSPSSNKLAREDLLIQAATGALQERDPIGALQYIDEIEQKNTKNPAAHHMKALAFYMRGDLPKAEAAARKSISLDSKNSSVKTTLGQILIDSGKAQEAEGVLTEAASDPLSRDSFKANTNLGILAYRRGDLAGSRSRLDTAIRDGDGDACVAFYYRGHVNLAENKSAEALKDYESASRKSCGTFGDAHLAVGIVHLRTRNYEAARKKFLEVNTMFPDTALANEALKKIAELP
jgi:tetratricopeptide (TPR) repeat protein